MQNKNKSLERMYPITFTCRDCGAEFTVSVKEQLFARENKGFVLPKRCKDCREKRKDRAKQIICCDCGEVFEFTASEQEFYEKNGFQEPKRCRACRRARKDSLNGQDISKEDK